MVTGHFRGWLIKYENNQWVYDDGTSIKKERACKRCNKMATPEGYDACIGFVAGASSVCCGHGVEKPYIVWDDGI